MLQQRSRQPLRHEPPSKGSKHASCATEDGHTWVHLTFQAFIGAMQRVIDATQRKGAPVLRGRERGRQPAQDPLQAVLAQAPGAGLLEGQARDGRALRQTRHGQLVLA